MYVAAQNRRALYSGDVSDTPFPPTSRHPEARKAQFDQTKHARCDISLQNPSPILFDKELLGAINCCFAGMGRRIQARVQLSCTSRVSLGTWRLINLSSKPSVWDINIPQRKWIKIAAITRSWLAYVSMRSIFSLSAHSQTIRSGHDLRELAAIHHWYESKLALTRKGIQPTE